MTYEGTFKSGRTPLHIHNLKEGTITPGRYIDVLSTHMVPSLIENNLIFQQDNASIHRSKETSRWFTMNGIEPIVWPAKSPDLSPVEQMWNLVRTEVYENEYQTLEQFVTAIQTYWNGIEQQKVDNLIDSFPHRLEECLELKGDITHY